MPKCPTTDCNELPKSALHAHLKEHRDGPDGITVHPGDESMELVFLCSMSDR
jgi:hypothetical protein